MKHLSYSLAILVATTLFAADQKPKSDKEMIQGTWDIVSTDTLKLRLAAAGEPRPAKLAGEFFVCKRVKKEGK